VSTNVEAVLPHPFDDVGAATNLFIDARWQRKGSLWLRLTQPLRDLYRDFRIERVFRFPERSYILLSLGRHWATQRTTAVLIAEDNTRVRTLAAEEFNETLDLLSSDSTFDDRRSEAEPSDIRRAYDLVMKRDAKICFGEFHEWGRLDDLSKSGITNGVSVFGASARVREHLRISWLNMSPEQELVKLEDMYGCETLPMTIVAAFQDTDGSEFKAFALENESEYNQDPPPRMVARAIGADAVEILSVEQLVAVAPLYLDTIERL